MTTKNEKRISRKRSKGALPNLSTVCQKKDMFYVILSGPRDSPNGRASLRPVLIFITVGTLSPARG